MARSRRRHIGNKTAQGLYPQKDESGPGVARDEIAIATEKSQWSELHGQHMPPYTLELDGERRGEAGRGELPSP